MGGIDRIEIELTVVIGETELPLARLLRMGRGAVLPLGGDGNQPLEIRANGRSIGAGRVLLDGDQVNVEIKSNSSIAA